MANATKGEIKMVKVTLPAAEVGEGIIEVGHNGNMYLLKRGETVTVPEPVRDILVQAGILAGEGA